MCLLFTTLGAFLSSLSLWMLILCMSGGIYSLKFLINFSLQFFYPQFFWKKSADRNFRINTCIIGHYNPLHYVLDFHTNAISTKSGPNRESFGINWKLVYCMCIDIMPNSINYPEDNFSMTIRVIYIVGHSVRIRSQFHTPLMLCLLILIIIGETYSIKSYCLRTTDFFERIFMAIFF